MIENIITLLTLVFLQGVLGIDNLLYIAIESRRVAPEFRTRVRRIGIIIAVALRIVLLVLLINLIAKFQNPFFLLDNDFLSGHFTLHSIIVLVGGVFILYTATKEIFHVINFKSVDENENDVEFKSNKSVIVAIVLMNIIFSFDSILAAMALTDILFIMVFAIILGSLIMIFLADRVSNFIKKNRMFEVLGLFILFIVGIMLLTEGAHLSHLKVLDNEILPMSKSTFYFVISVLVLIDIVQHRYNKRLNN